MKKQLVSALMAGTLAVTALTGCSSSAPAAQTYDSTSFAPDSASTATSIATGHKTGSGSINVSEDFTESYETIAEKLKKQKGYKIGLLSSVNLNHATPAAFYAHQQPRNSYYEIGQELIASDFDYLAGGGLKQATGKEKNQEDLYSLAENAGYKVIKTQAEAEKLTADDGKAILIGEHLADDDALSYELDRKADEWSLADYVEKGIEVLDNDTGALEMTAYEYSLLKEAYETTLNRTGEESEFGQEEYIKYGSYEPLTVTITHILNNKSGINFGSYAHTGLPVAVLVKGASANTFDGYYDNTEIYKRMASLTGVN